MDNNVKEKNNSKGVIVLLCIIIAILLALCTLFATGTISLNNKQTSNEQTDNGSTQVEESANKKILTNDEAIIEGKRLYDKATEIYETWMLIPYCGVVRSDIKEEDIEKLGDSGYGNSNYYKSNFANLDELKTYLKQWLSENIVNDKVVKSNEWNGETYYKYVEDLSLLSKQDNHYAYIDYVLKDNKLYCRLDTGKGWLSLYQGKYDIKVENIEENRITYTITSAYGKNDSDCYWGIKTCDEKDLEYKDTTFVIEKNSSGNFVVTNYTLHE